MHIPPSFVGNLVPQWVSSPLLPDIRIGFEVVLIGAPLTVTRSNPRCYRFLITGAIGGLLHQLVSLNIERLHTIG
ncbi:hypothetical protein QFZ91_006041 [Paraburkholderia sp. JPY419]